MEKRLILLAFLIAVGITAQAQEIAPNAIGIRIGDNDGFGTEVNYQRALSENNRVELGLGYRNARNFNAVRLQVSTSGFGNIDGGFNWYAGVGASAGSFDFDNDLPVFVDRDSFFLNAAGNIGIEYKFDIPLLLSLDFRPEIAILNDFDDNLEYDLALGIRYTF